MFQRVARRAFCQVVQRRTICSSSPLLSGHNKWSKIKDKKGAADAQKSALYSKVNNEISIAVKAGGSADPVKNVNLANVLKRAKEQGVPKDNIEKALARAAGKQTQQGERVTYEVLAGGLVGVIVECATDNVNRTLHSVRETVTSHNARLAPVKYLFERQGRVIVEFTSHLESEFVDLCLVHDAKDFHFLETDGPLVRRAEVICDPANLAQLEKGLSAVADLRVELSELIYASPEKTDAPENVQDQVSRLVEDLELNDDVIHIWTSLQQ